MSTLSRRSKPASAKTASGGWLFPAVWFVAFSLISAFCFWYAFDDAGSQRHVAAALAEQSEAPPQYVTKAIRDIEIFDWVMADNPQLEASAGPWQEIVADQWRQISLRMDKPDGRLLEIELARPLEWVEAHGAEESATIALDIAAMGAVGPAEVLAVAACPDIPPKPHDGCRLVTGTYRHLDANILDVQIEGQDEPIGTTANHRWWSEDRQSFVEAHTLRPGERLRRADGTFARVQSLAERTHPEPVYNIEVDGQNVYYVSTDGILVHNAYGQSLRPRREIALGMDLPGGGYKALANQTGASGWRHWARDGITRRTPYNRFGRAYHQAAQRANKIHFSLDGINDANAAVRAGKKGFVRDNVTNAELEYLVRNQELLNKTIFYRTGPDGIVGQVPSPFQ